MNTRFWIAWGGLLGLTLFLACAEEACTTDASPTRSAVVNPNGDSELALLMRAMYDDAMVMKEQIAVGKRPLSTLDPEEIFTAEATEPEKAASEAYRSFGEAYLQAAEALADAPPGDYHTFYTGMVQTCMDCHQELCPGPTRKIVHLFTE